MTNVVYDGSFEGFLTAVFEVYEYRFYDAQIVKKDCYNKVVFNKEHHVVYNEAKAARLWKGILKYLSQQSAMCLYHTWLSEVQGIEQTLYDYMKYLFVVKQNIAEDFSHPSVLQVSKMAKKVSRERHRMTAFVRFQLTGDGLFFATVEPDFNVLPLIISHFQKRYADQRWLIYDTRRKYGIYYDLQKVEYIQMSFNENTSNAPHMMYDEQEPLYQKLWQKYFSSVNIKARKNTKLHIQHMPRRYWKYLVEKQV